MCSKNSQQLGLNLTWAPWYLWRCQMGRFGGCSWNLRRTDFHRCPMPEPPAPTACCLGPAHYSWGTRCFCAARSPWQWRSQGAGERWTGSPRCLCKECLGDKAAVICGCESIIGVCHWWQILVSLFKQEVSGDISLLQNRHGQNEIHRRGKRHLRFTEGIFDT